MDRAWCNFLGHGVFEGVTVQHLERTTFDHHPILLTDTQTQKRPGFKEFRFLNAWLQHPDFIPAVERFWTKEPSDLGETIAKFKTEMMHWNNQIFGNIFQKKKKFVELD